MDWFFMRLLPSTQMSKGRLGGPWVTRGAETTPGETQCWKQDSDIGTEQRDWIRVIKEAEETQWWVEHRAKEEDTRTPPSVPAWVTGRATALFARMNQEQGPLLIVTREEPASMLSRTGTKVKLVCFSQSSEEDTDSVCLT